MNEFIIDKNESAVVWLFYMVSCSLNAYDIVGSFALWRGRREMPGCFVHGILARRKTFFSAYTTFRERVSSISGVNLLSRLWMEAV